MNLAVKIGKLRLKNPVMTASGTFGPEYGELVDINNLGAIVMKTITLAPRIGNPPPRLAETAAGMLNSIGLENKGLDDFIRNKISALKNIKIPVIASIACCDKDEFKELAKRLDGVKRISALEINLSCPNLVQRTAYSAQRMGETGMIAQDEKATYEVVSAVRKVATLTLIAKLSPNVTDITKIAKAAEAAGADAVLIANTFTAMAVDIDTKRPMLGNTTGGLSGPAIKPIVLRMVYETYDKVKIPIIGCGGIMNSNDAIEYILCGASAVQIGTANFVNPRAGLEIANGIKRYMEEGRIKDVRQLVGGMKRDE